MKRSILLLSIFLLKAYVQALVASTNGCPDGSIPTNCIVNPCSVSNCNRFRNATAVSNYCGGCNCEYYVDGHEVTNECECPSGSPPSNCEEDPCVGSRCGRFPLATAVSNYCGGCECEYYVDGREVTNECGCPDGSMPVNCFADPCSVSNCNRFRNATAVSNYCGGCNCEYYVDGHEVTNECECANGSPPSNCEEDPCEGSRCTRFPIATAVSNYCGGCECEYYVDGLKVTNVCEYSDGNPPVDCEEVPRASLRCLTIMVACAVIMWVNWT